MPDNEYTISLNQIVGVVLHDCILESQTKIKEYFTRSRNKNISYIYLSQAYTTVDLKFIRNNLHFIVVYDRSDYETNSEGFHD